MVPEIAFALLVAGASAAADTLDSLGHAPPAMVERLRAECLRKRARITTEFARYDVRVGRLEGVGLGGFKTIGSSPHPPDPITWPSVVRIETVRTNALLGMGMGAATGLLLALAKDGDPTQTVATTLAGGLVGQQVGCRITRGDAVYVAQPRTPSPPPVAAAPVAAAPAVVPAGIDLARVDKACAEIRHDRLLRVTFEDIPSVEGYALSADRNGVRSLQPKERSGSTHSLPEVISWNRIDGIHGLSTSAGSSAVKGAVIIGVTGALAGAALGGLVGATAEGDMAGSAGAYVAAGAALGALTGAVLGGILGAVYGGTPKWVAVY